MLPPLLDARTFEWVLPGSKTVVARWTDPPFSRGGAAAVVVVGRDSGAAGLPVGQAAFAAAGLTTPLTATDLPVSILVARCGDVIEVAAGGMDAAAKGRFEALLVALSGRNESCPMAIPPATVIASKEARQPLLVGMPGKLDATSLVFARPSALEEGFKVTDALLAIPAQGTHVAASHGAPLRLAGRRTLLAIGATWCQPCIEELPDLLALAERLHADWGVELVLVSVDGGAGGPAGLWNAFAKIRELAGAAHPGAPAPAFPAWATLRGDPAGAWIALVDRFFAAPAPSGEPATRVREGGIPLALLFDECGALEVVVQERLDPGTAELLAKRAEALAGSPPCGVGDGP